MALSTNTTITASVLANFEPLSTLSSSRLQELVGLCFVENVSKEINPLRLNMAKTSQLMFLLSGDLGLRFKEGSKKILRAGSPAAKYSIDERRLALQDTIALTDIQVIRIDLDLLDILMTWDQLSRIKPIPKATPQKQEPLQTSLTPQANLTSQANPAPQVLQANQTSPAPQANPTPQINEQTAPALVEAAEASQINQASQVSQWMRDTEMFSAQKLKSGIFSRLPSANIEEMFRRMQYLVFNVGQVVVQQGAAGDYYYLLESGAAEVSRITVSQNKPERIKEHAAGDFFGEEAVVSEGKSNVTVTMLTDGAVLRLKKSDFNELLKAPLIHQVTLAQTQKALSNGSAVLVDVRFPSEFKFDAMDGAVNLPLNQIRHLMADLDKTKQYITYCQTGRRSSAAAFILIEQGFDAVVLERL
jgi:rhodanese-related sulfurtransferase